LPCDIAGDVSYEELRAAAYDDAKRGINLQAIVERERNLLNNKLMEYDNFVRSPYGVPQRTSSAGHSIFPPSNNSASSVDAQKNITPSLSSFSQPGASANVGPTISRLGAEAMRGDTSERLALANFA
ncbi:hypothetical protein Taro_024174, partial [Colocasia esculenta]|nr:hypothetical protein [Colocasia esculenta]